MLVPGEIYSYQCAHFRIHGGAAQLGSGHFTKAFESADVDFLRPIKNIPEQFISVVIVTGIPRIACLRDSVKRRLGQIQATVFY